MANQPETNSYDSGVYQIELLDPVQGGVGGLTNKPLLNLANRTNWLWNQIQSILSAIATLAPINSPNLTGTPTSPTPAAGDSSTKVATTAFLSNAESGVATVNVAAGGTITLTAAQYGCGIIEFTGAMAANATVVFPNNGKWFISNQTSGAFTVGCKTSGGSNIVSPTQGFAQPIWCDGTNVNPGFSDFNNVNLIGQPTAPTPSPGDDSTNICTTAFLTTALANQPHGVQVYATHGTYTFTVPANVYWIKVLVGGGGASGIGASTTGASTVAAGGGGNSGPIGTGLFAVTPGATYTVTVGAGGVWSTGSPGSSGSGGTSSFGALISAPGATGGASDAPANPPPLTQGIMPGTAIASGGNLLNLHEGIAGNPIAMGISNAVSGKGADSPFGRGGAPIQSTSSNGNSGTGNCAGGSGALVMPSGVQKAGGVGAPGIVIVEW